MTAQGKEDVSGQPPRKHTLFHNWTSVLGGIGAAISFAIILFLFILDFTHQEGNPYLGILTYFFFPGILVFNLFLVLFGAWLERKRRLKRGYVRKFPQIDFNNPAHRQIGYLVVIIATLFLLFSAVGSYRAYEFTESVTFCGKTCHQVMKPEYTAYHNSPHANVACAKCHIGPGADWFVRSKLSGSYQIYSSIFKKYHRPIKTPVKNLRPAQETCEQCHWPQKFFGAVEQDKKYFLPDEKNSEWNTRMLMHVGGGAPPYGKREGIHWHMSIKNKVYYVATDEKRQVIPWVKIIGPDGKEEVYVSEGEDYSKDKLPVGEFRKMDCIDCHNRPSHIYKSPAKALNEALAYGVIDKSLPYIKREATKALIGKYETEAEAEIKIKKYLEDFYASKYPDWSKTNQLSQSIDSVIKIYKNNFFPEMKVNWREYPDNIGHFVFNGCFRCHDGKHKSNEGKVITNNCNSCHTIISQGNPADSTTMEESVKGLEFKHPGSDVGDTWKEMSCVDCHTGGSD